MTREILTPDQETPGAAGSGSEPGDRRRFLGGLAVGAAAAFLACDKGKGGAAPKAEGMEAVKPEGMTEEMKAAPVEGMEVAKAEPAKAEPAKAEPAKAAAGAGKSRVVQVVNPKAYDPKGKPAAAPVKEMVDRAVMELTGKATPKEAWSSLFQPNEKVGLKPNCLGKHLCWPSEATVDAIIEGLLSAGVPYGNMYMWDMWGFDASPLSTRYRKSAMHVKPIKAWGFDKQVFKIPSGGPVQFTKPLMLVDAVVNIGVIKDHDLSGVTCALKNMAFGSIPNPFAFHGTKDGKKLCDPTVPEIYALDPIKKKARLILVDAFNIIVNGGPRGNPGGLRKLHSVFAATDPVAMDRTAWTIIDGFRKQSNLPLLMERPEGRGRPTHVLSAEKLGLGTADPARIEHLVKTIG